MIKNTHITHQKRKIRNNQLQSINHSEPNSIELCQGQFVDQPLEHLIYFPLPTLHPSFSCGLHQSEHTGVIPQISCFLFLINIKKA